MGRILQVKSNVKQYVLQSTYCNKLTVSTIETGMTHFFMGITFSLQITISIWKKIIPMKSLRQSKSSSHLLK